jgi:hypothetical protein
VKVYYDLSDASNAILEKGLGSMGQKQLLLAGGIFGGILAAFGGILGITLLVMCVVLAGVLLVLGKIFGLY